MSPDILTGDCLEVLAEHGLNNSFDLILTSPPYADARKKTYGGVLPTRSGMKPLRRSSRTLLVAELRIEHHVFERRTKLVVKCHGMIDEQIISDDELIHTLNIKFATAFNLDRVLPEIILTPEQERSDAIRLVYDDVGLMKGRKW